MVISSYVIDAMPARREEVAQAVASYDGVEVHGNEGNRLIVTIEAGSIDQTYGLATKVSQISGVLATNLVYCNFEDETL